MTSHPWQFKSRFRRHAFGWRSDTPIKRIKEAVAEIKQVARNEPAVAADGAVILLEKLSPALEGVDSSSGAIGTAVNRAIDVLVPIIASADVDAKVRQGWLDRLWAAFQDDGVPYIEVLGDYWGELCAGPEVASQWADLLLPALELAWSPGEARRGYFKGTSACFACLYAARRYDELLALIDKAPFMWWHNRRWGVKALIALGRSAEALRYAEASRGRNDPGQQIALVCESILLSSGMQDEAYRRYAIEANQAATHLATFRGITKKYLGKRPDDILRDLIASTPGAEGKWFAAAKDAGLFEVAIELAKHSPTDPRTLIRAARDYCEDQPDFAVQSGLAALRWISRGHGYEITDGDVLAAYSSVINAAPAAGIAMQEIGAQINAMVAEDQAGSQFVTTILGRQLQG